MNKEDSSASNQVSISGLTEACHYMTVPLLI
jgi:hypothetical protein